nr:hypothetical protein CFP56_57785 [Quercus suber]
MATRKFGDEKVDAIPSSTINVAPPSPTPSLEVTVVTTPKTRPKGKSKIGQSVWDDPATALGRAHNVITNDKLKSLSSIPSHKLVSQHIHKLVQVLGEWLCITTDYLNIEEKVVVSTSKAESMEKDEEIQSALLKTDEERVKVINNFKESEEFSDLQFIQYFKGFELLRRWAMKHHSAVVNFSNLDFEKIDTKILEDESKELEKDSSKEIEMDESGILEKDKATEVESPAPPS